MKILNSLLYFFIAYSDDALLALADIQTNSQEYQIAPFTVIG
ncbi:MAG: hypothetical protein AAF518_04440 [Spirochaetota bacterium]